MKSALIFVVKFNTCPDRVQEDSLREKPIENHSSSSFYFLNNIQLAQKLINFIDHAQSKQFLELAIHHQGFFWFFYFEMVEICLPVCFKDFLAQFFWELVPKFCDRYSSNSIVLIT